MNQDCIFCKIVEGSIPSEKVYSDDSVVAFKDINPQAPVHILIVPKKHISTINHLSENDETLIGHLITVARSLAKQTGISEDGYRLVLNCNQGAGQTVFHIHLHLLGGRIFSWPPG